MEDKILNELKRAENYISGEYLSSTLNISRSAIWKHIKNLKSKGYLIDGISNKGYKLISSPDLLNKSELLPLLNTSIIGKNIIHFDDIDSTNIKAKELAQKDIEDGSIIISEKQTLGSGRFNRKWFSPLGGLWFTLVLRPNIPPTEAPKITQIAAASIYKTLRDFNINTTIKWPNDILLNDKKLCGILAEMKCDMDRVHYLILGIGISVYPVYKAVGNSMKITEIEKIQYRNAYSDRLDVVKVYENALANVSNNSVREHIESHDDPFNAMYLNEFTKKDLQAIVKDVDREKKFGFTYKKKMK